MTSNFLKTLCVASTLLLGSHAFAEHYDWTAAEADLEDDIAYGNWGVAGGFFIETAPEVTSSSAEYSDGNGNVCKDYYVTLIKTKTNRGGNQVEVEEETVTYCQPENN